MENRNEVDVSFSILDRAGNEIDKGSLKNGVSNRNTSWGSLETLLDEFLSPGDYLVKLKVDEMEAQLPFYVEPNFP